MKAFDHGIGWFETAARLRKFDLVGKRFDGRLVAYAEHYTSYVGVALSDAGADRRIEIAWVKRVVRQ